MKISVISKKPRGFTLIEMLVTITIIVILAGLSLGGFKYITYKQEVKKAELQVQLLSQALEEYKVDKGNYPTGTSYELFLALYDNGITNPNTDKIYVPDLDPVNNKQGWISGTGATTKIIDPWGEEYIYENPGTFNPDFDIISKGPDRLTSDDRSNPENKDDITN